MPNPLVSATILAFLGVTLYVPIALCEGKEFVATNTDILGLPS